MGKCAETISQYYPEMRFIQGQISERERLYELEGKERKKQINAAGNQKERKKNRKEDASVTLNFS